MKSVCAHPECDEEVPRAIYACTEHWNELPLHYKHKIHHGYKLLTKEGNTRVWVNAHQMARAYWINQNKERRNE